MGGSEEFWEIAKNTLWEMLKRDKQICPLLWFAPHAVPPPALWRALEKRPRTQHTQSRPPMGQCSERPASATSPCSCPWNERIQGIWGGNGGKRGGNGGKRGEFWMPDGIMGNVGAARVKRRGFDWQPGCVCVGGLQWGKLLRKNWGEMGETGGPSPLHPRPTIFVIFPDLPRFHPISPPSPPSPSDTEALCQPPPQSPPFPPTVPPPAFSSIFSRFHPISPPVPPPFPHFPPILPHFPPLYPIPPPVPPISPLFPPFPPQSPPFPPLCPPPPISAGAGYLTGTLQGCITVHQVWVSRRPDGAWGAAPGGTAGSSPGAFLGHCAGPDLSAGVGRCVRGPASAPPVALVLGLCRGGSFRSLICC